MIRSCVRIRGRWASKPRRLSKRGPAHQITDMQSSPRRASKASYLENGTSHAPTAGPVTKLSTRGGTRTRNLLLRREAPYPLGHTSSWCSSVMPVSMATTIGTLRIGVVAGQQCFLSVFRTGAVADMAAFAVDPILCSNTRPVGLEAATSEQAGARPPGHGHAELPKKGQEGIVFGGWNFTCAKSRASD